MKEWITNHPDAKPLMLAYYGDVDPGAMGIHSSEFDNSTDSAHDLTKQTLAAGWYAISVNLCHGVAISSFGKNAKRLWINPATCEQFRRLEPIAKAGYSILIYHLAVGSSNN